MAEYAEQPSKVHEDQLKRHCRVCAKPFARNEYKYSCSANPDVLKVTLGKKMQLSTLPRSATHATPRHSDKRKDGYIDSTLEVHEWTEHPTVDSVQCSTCDFFRSQKRGGRPKRTQKNRGRPSTSSNRSLADTVESQAPPSWNTPEPLQPSRFLPPPSVSLEDMQCSFCDCIADSPVVMPCRKIACARCVGDGIRKSKERSLHCPCCKSHHEIVDASQFPPVSEVTLKLLGSMLLKCDRCDCSEIVELRKLREHLESGCRKGMVTYPAPKLTLEQVLSRPLTSPPTTVEKKAAAMVVKRLFAEAKAGPSSSSVVQLPTAGSVRGVHV